MEKITITRRDEYQNISLDYKIFLDGKKVGTLANGERKEFTLPVGQHIVHAKVAWLSSQELIIDVKENKSLQLAVGGGKNGRYQKFVLPLIFIILAVSKYIDNDYLLNLIVPLFLYRFYYLTIARKKYLTLEEIHMN